MANVNQLSINDVYLLLNDLHEQTTGKKSIAPTNTAEFVSMANATLSAGVDSVYNALMQTIGMTIFSSRPYNQKFRGLKAENVRWGGIIRKIVLGDKPLNAESAYHPIDGQSIDQYVINKSDVLELRYYGSNVYQDSYTVFKEQLINAMRGPEELASFVALQTEHMNNKWVQYQEELSRGMLANFIGAKVSLDNGVIHLLSEYNALTGLSLTATDIYKPDYQAPFFRFVRSRVNTISRRMTERSELYQVKITGHDINRHTPLENQKMYLTADALDIIDAMVLTQTYHDDPLRYADVEGVSHWQAIENPNQISVSPVYIGSDGTLVNGDPIVVNNIFGIIFDEDAMAYNLKDVEVSNTPYNARGRYFNTWMTSNVQYLEDLTEKGVILLLD